MWGVRLAAAAAAPAGEWDGEEQERRGAEEAVKAGGRADWEERGFATADARELCRQLGVRQRRTGRVFVVLG